ncbi:hypothetical protein J6590_028268 [Homalodisca vitripennis]|nr:hypothetical protein J6590_107183 [Homalodisca vitripennis]KAG8322197.1 hypothetical protein J6590_028268 [Homalodisca vitripennis]
MNSSRTPPPPPPRPADRRVVLPIASKSRISGHNSITVSFVPQLGPRQTDCPHFTRCVICEDCGHMSRDGRWTLFCVTVYLRTVPYKTTSEDWWTAKTVNSW